MNREESPSKTVMSWVVSSIMLDGDSTFWENGHLLSPKIVVMGGLPYPPPKVLWKGGEEMRRMNGPGKLKAHYMPKMRSPKLQRFYIETVREITIFVAL